MLYNVVSIYIIYILYIYYIYILCVYIYIYMCVSDVYLIWLLCGNCLSDRVLQMKQGLKSTQSDL